MKALHQLFRQPVKTIAGILMTALALAILIASAGQLFSTQIAKANLSDGYSTVAAISDEYFWEIVPGDGVHHHAQIADENARAWAEGTIQNRKDLFWGESFTEVYSAYAPELSPDIFSQYENGDSIAPLSYGAGNPYRCAMLEVTISTVGSTLGEEVFWLQVAESNEWQECRKRVYILCEGIVENVIGLEKGFASPVGKRMAFTISAYNEAAIQAMELEAGKRYLLFGMDYSDMRSSQLESRIADDLSMYEEIFGSVKAGLNGPECDAIMEQIDCYMTVCDYASLPITYAGENGFELRTDLREYVYKDGETLITTYVPASEFMSKYSVPTIAKLDGTADSYLDSEEGKPWQQALRSMEISNHCFPVFAVDKAVYQMTFAREDARIEEGRDFTEEERTTGAKVCIVSEYVAKYNDLSIGDTVHLQTYPLDDNIKVQSSERLMYSFPNGWLYSPAIGFTSEPEAYTIVGIYRQINAWENTDDPYGITPNTIFVPKGSITGDARTGTKGIFYSLVLHNGKMQELQKLQNEAGYPDLFLCFDQGYSKIVKALDAYEGVSQKAFYIGAASCGVILLLFLALFPLQQGKNLSIMCSLGAPRSKRIGFVVGSSFGILLPGTILGGTAGALLWKQVAAKLMESVNVSIPMSANTLVLSLSLSAALLLVSLALVTLLAVCISGDKGLSKRK